MIFTNASTIRCACHDPRDACHPLRQDGGLPITVGIEYAAQAAALHAATLRLDAMPVTGHLAILQDVQWYIERLDQVEGAVEVTAEQGARLANGLAYRFALHAQDRDLIVGRMIIALDIADP